MQRSCLAFGAALFGCVSAISLAAGASQPAKTPPPTPPPIIDAGAPGQLEGAAAHGKAPQDAVVLFSGSGDDLARWRTRDGKPAAWSVADGVMTIAPGTGDIMTNATFGDCQIHVEFRTPKTQGDGQDRGNSGIYVLGRYEVQVLDSHQSTTYPDGQCGAIYGKHIPSVNATRAPGQWQTFDIVFRAPRFDGAGKKIANARFTVLHNGVLIHNDVEVDGATGSALAGNEVATGPILLQDHGHLVSYRNLWVRPLGAAGASPGK